MPISRRDPLADVPGAGPYVLHANARAAYSALREALRRCEPALLVGPAGSGKSALLRELARELDPDHRVLRAPFLHFAPDEIASFLQSLGSGSASPADDRTWLAGLREHVREGRPTVLLADEAQSIPAASADHLAALADEAGPALRLVLAGQPGRPLTRVARAFGAELRRVELRAPDREALLEQYHALLDAPMWSTEQRHLLESVDVDALLRVSELAPRGLRLELARVLYDWEREGAAQTWRRWRLGADAPGALVHPSRSPSEANEDPVETAARVTALAREATPEAARPARRRRAGGGASSHRRLPEPRPARVRATPTEPEGTRPRTHPRPRRWLPLHAEGGASRWAAFSASADRPARSAPISASRDHAPAARSRRRRPRLAARSRIRPTVLVSRHRVRRVLASATSAVHGLYGLAAAQSARAARAVAHAPSLAPGAALPVAVLLALLLITHQDPQAARLGGSPEVLVNVNAIPWARIAVDGHEVGETPLGNIRLPSGQYSFQAVFADGSVSEQSVEIGPGSRFVSFRRDG